MVARLIVLHGDVVILGGARVFLFQTPEALEHLLVAFHRSLLVQAGRQFLKLGFKAFTEERLNALFFTSPVAMSGSTV